jgi:hypothetical protein
MASRLSSIFHEPRSYVYGVLRKLKLLGHKDVVLIDARNDNKPSGSKAEALRRLLIMIAVLLLLPRRPASVVLRPFNVKPSIPGFNQTQSARMPYLSMQGERHGIFACRLWDPEIAKSVR